MLRAVGLTCHDGSRNNSFGEWPPQPRFCLWKTRGLACAGTVVRVGPGKWDKEAEGQVKKPKLQAGDKVILVCSSVCSVCACEKAFSVLIPCPTKGDDYGV